MQSIMVNRKPFGNFKFSAHLQKRSIFLLFCLFAFYLILDNLQKTKTDTKKAVFLPFLPENVRFCRK